jgi:hypothetical protein
MRRILLLTWISLWPFSVSAFAQQEARGLLIYEEPSTSYAETMEYRSFSRDNPIYSTVVQVNGQRKQVKTAGVLANFDYPPLTFDSSFPDTARSNLDKLQTLERQLPDVRGQLEATRAKWERALSAYRQTSCPVPADQASAILPSLRVDTEQYAHARLVAATHDTATIAHDAGVVRIPIQRLNPSQIVSLNSTSKTTQLGTNLPPPEEEVPRAQAKDDPSTSWLRDKGMGALGYVERQTGISAEAIRVWLLFAVLPLFIVILVILNLVQGRKVKK